jgi:RNA polymerase sigma-70 factor (ECF subfamily)
MTATDSTPVSLLERLKRREDIAAWDRFVALYTPLLYHWLRGAGLNEHDAADLVQDIFAKLIVQMPLFKYDPSQSFHAWLRTVAMNCRRDSQKRRAPLTVGDGELEAFAPDAIESFIEREYRNQLAIRAMHILRSDFKPQTWQAVWDLVVEGKPADQVAASARMTVQAVYAAKCRVLARLRQELQGLWC